MFVAPPLGFPTPVRSPHRFCGSSPPELLCVRWASFCLEPELSAGTWLPQPNPSAERSGPRDPERGSLSGRPQRKSHKAAYFLTCSNRGRGGQNTWNIFGELHQNLNLTCCHFRQQQEVFLGAVLVLELVNEDSPSVKISWAPRNTLILTSYQFFCHVLRNLMFVVSICDDFHERLLLFCEWNLFLRANKEAPHPDGTFLLLVQSKHQHFQHRRCFYLWWFIGGGDVFAVPVVSGFCLVSGRLSRGGFGVLS